jgi:hypothetical protein
MRHAVPLADADDKVIASQFTPSPPAPDVDVDAMVIDSLPAPLPLAPATNWAWRATCGSDDEL